MDETDQERFEPTNGRVPGFIGIGLAGLLAAGALLDGWHASDPALLAGLALTGLVMTAVLLRPVVIVDGRDLVLRNMFSTTRVDLAAVDEVEVRHVLTLLAAGQRLHSTAVHRTKKRRPSPRGRKAAAEQTAPTHPVYADLIESRIRTLAADARRVHKKPADPAVRRAWSWPLVGSAAGLGVLTLVLLVVP